MKLSIPILFLLTLFSTQLIAQVFSWGGDCPTDGASIVIEVTADAEGSLYTFVRFNGMTDLDPSDMEFMVDGGVEGAGAIQKIDENGNLEWVKIFETINMDGIISNSIVATDMTVDNDGDLYIVGSYLDSIDFDPGIGNHFENSEFNSRDAFILKLNTDGEFQWVKTVGDFSDEYPQAVTVDNNGDICITGGFLYIVDFDPGEDVFNMSALSSSINVFILKLDSDGGFIWAKQIASETFAWATDIACDLDNNLFVSGIFDETADFDPSIDEHNLTANGYDNSFLLKITENGDYSWVGQIGVVEQFSGASSIDVDNSGNVYISGYFSGDNVDFNFGDEEYLMSSDGSKDLFLASYSGDGDFIWADRFGTFGMDSESEMAISNDDNIYFKGIYSHDIDVDPSEDEFILESVLGGEGTTDFYLLTLNLSGELINALRFGGGEDEEITDLAVGPDRTVFLCGLTNSDLDLDPSDVEEFIIDGDTEQAATFVLKLQTGYLGISKENNNKIDFNLYPNPVNAEFTIELNENTDKITILITTVEGKLIQKHNYTDTSIIKTDFDYPNGIYFVTVLTEKGQHTIKIVK